MDMEIILDKADKYYAGDGVPLDKVKAFELYCKAARAGDAYSQWKVGYMYNNGLGVDQDISQANEYYMMSSDQGFSEAMYALGYNYMNGDGFEVNEAKAISYYLNAAKLGHAAACYRLGFYYYYKSAEQPELLTQAIAFYEKSALLDYPDALIALGDLYVLGVGVEQSDAKAKELYSLAMEYEGYLASEVAAERLKEFSHLKKHIWDQRFPRVDSK